MRFFSYDCSACVQFYTSAGKLHLCGSVRPEFRPGDFLARLRSKVGTVEFVEAEIGTPILVAAV